MKKTMKMSLQKATAILLSAIIVLSAFAMMPADLFTAKAALDTAWYENRLELDFNNNWKFCLGDDSGASLKAFDDSTWETVELPHDFSISQNFFADDSVEGESGNLPGGTGWYRKTFVMATDARDQAVYLNFDGAYKDTYVYVNGELIGENHYGYNSFSFDISDYLIYNGETANVIAVKVENQLPSSRWYSGSGIYRDVTMTIADPVHVDLYGTYVTTPNLESSNGTDGTVNAEVTIANTNYDETIDITAKILDSTGAEVGTSASQTGVTVAGKTNTTVTLTPSLENPALWNSWDLGTPNLYTLRIEISKEGTVVDTYDTDFGYRWFNWDADTGFSLNGKNVKLEGVCMHHDQGALGAVQEYDAIYRQVMILKDMGCNAIRTSHGTPSDVFMDICNKVGMLVMDEFFDGWDTAKNSNTNDFSAYFDEEIDTSTNGILNAEDGQMWYEFVVQQSVKRDRNDPAVVIWDVGNELPEGGSYGDFDTIAENMTNIIKSLDDERPICQGNNAPGETGSNTRGSVDSFMDVIGGNYNTSSWISLMEGTSDSRSTKPYVGTETASAITSRGIYDTLSYYNYWCTSYDTNCVTWGDTAADIWYNTITRDWNSGEFVWTGFDYIGEPTPWNAYGMGQSSVDVYGSGAPSSSYFGIVDTAGFGKDSYYLYRSMWNEASTTLHLVPGTWDSSELVLNSGYAYVAVYSNAAKIELLGDGAVIASATSVITTTNAGHKYPTWTETTSNSNVNTTEFYTGDGNDLYPQFQVKQSAFSTISVKAYDEDGNDITDSAVGTKSTASSATNITSKAWNYDGFTADGDSFPYIEFTAVDANGNIDTTYNGTLTVTLSGDEAVIVGVDNGNQSTTEKFQQSSVLKSDTTATIQMFGGKALVILRSTEEASTGVEVTATASDGLSVTGATVQINAEAAAELEDEFEEIVPQPENLVYEPTIYDEYEILKDNILGDGSSSLEADYVLYSANPEGTTVTNMDIPDGWYIITGSDDQGGANSSGVLTHAAHSSGGFTSDGSTGVPDAASDAWYFQKISDGSYYIYYTDDSGNKQYLTISNNQVYVSTSPYPLAVTTDTSGNVTIGFGSTYLNYSGGTSQQVYWYSTATNLKLYYVDESDDGSSTTTTTYTIEGQVTDSTELASLEDGWYILKGAGWGNVSTGAITHTAHSSGGLQTDGTSATAVPTTTDNVMWYFEKQSGEAYYIYYFDDSGVKQYMTLSSSTITISTSPQELTVAASGSTITIGASNGYYVDFCGNENCAQHVATWSTGTSIYVYKVNEETVTGGATSTTTVTQVTNTSSLDGEYIITGSDDQGAYTYGAATHTLKSGGLTPSNTTAPFTADENNTWIIEPTDDGYYYIYYTENGTNYYIVITDANITTSTTATKLTITSNGSTAVIGDSTNTYQLNYYGNSSSVISEWNPGTAITFYKVETVTTSANGVTMWIPTASTELAPPVEEGEYVIYSNSYIAGGTQVTNTAGTYTGLERVAETPVSDVITALRANAYTFTLVDGTTNQYYITNSEGKYITMGSGNGSVTLTDTATALYVYGTTDNRVVIYSGSYVFDNFEDANNMFSCWSGTYTSAGSNQIMTLYKNENATDSADVPAEKLALYEALVAGIQYAPGTYSNSTYEALFTALQDGYAVLENDAATTEQIEQATVAITNAIAGLAVEYKYIPATLYKYGYVPEGDTPYNDGGALFNAKTYESMEAIIRADDDLMSQIKTAIDYDGTNGTTWLDGEADTALDTAIAMYAQIYSLSFTGAPVTDQADISEFEKTRWNVWCKSNTQGASESTEEGASVQGLFSALRVDGQPTDHVDYATLPYGNAIDNTNRTDFNTIDGLSVELTINGTATEVILPALNGISVHINDMFVKEDVLVDADDESQGYAKKYWELEFPLLATTNEYGINTYKYSSRDSEYVFQAEFDDENNSATAVLTPVDDWSINLHSKGTGTGFFPFNYQLNSTSEPFTGENAIYHYAFNYDMEFYIPMSGTYADGEDVVFEFSGDDDVLVYIDDVLVLDNGGLHGARTAAINFTDATLSYQYAMDVDAADGLVESTTENNVIYAYDDSNKTSICNGDELAALEKLNEVRTDGDYHTFSFYYIERGSTDSNCEMTFNLQQSSEHVVLYDQALVVDYGLPVEAYDTTEDDFISADAAAAGTKVEVLGIKNGNTAVNSVINFNGIDNENLIKFADEGTDTLTVPNMKYGNCEFTEAGVVSYTPNTIRMTDEDFFYFCSEVENDPTYAEGTIYYQFEKVSFIPATSIYYEDNFGTDITFNDGTVTTGSGHGTWTTVGDETAFANVKQAADLVDDDNANPYGFDPAYAGNDTTKNYKEYSGFSAKKVTVSADNLAKNGGTCPTVEFTFTGTGFDVISVTDKTTGVFYMEIFDEDGNRVGKRSVVDTYYGYAYGQLYADANGAETLEETDTPLYKSADNEALTKVATYYSTDENGETVIIREPSYLDVSGVGYTDTPTYYDADGNLTETETDEIAYAYAYAFGWVESADTTGLYQIPVIKKTGLDYGTYRVVLTPMYTALFDNTGAGQFDLYFDAIRIYDPAGKDDNINSNILTEYKHDNESYPYYLELKDMLIGADYLSVDSSTQGIVFIDGIAALDNDLEKLKLAGPNNELYLAKDQAVAFEIWATAVPDEVQIGMKSANGTPDFTVTYGDKTATQTLNTSTEMNYILNGLLPADGKLTWAEVEVDGETYYRTDTIVIQNTSTDDSLLAITTVKWTFTGVGQYGRYEASASETSAVMTLMSSEATVSDAYLAMALKPITNEGTVTPGGDVPTPDEDGENEAGSEIIPGDDEDTNDTNEEYQEELSWIQKIIKAITNFFKKIFGLA